MLVRRLHVAPCVNLKLKCTVISAVITMVKICTQGIVTSTNRAATELETMQKFYKREFYPGTGNISTQLARIVLTEVSYYCDISRCSVVILQSQLNTRNSLSAVIITNYNTRDSLIVILTESSLSISCCELLTLIIASLWVLAFSMRISQIIFPSLFTSFLIIICYY